MIIHGDVAFMIVSTVLVLFMTPGLAFFYGGLVERKNSLTMMFQTFICIGVVTVLWILGGFSLVFGSDIGGVIGNPLDFFALKNVTFTPNIEYSDTIPFILFFMYQLMFAIITAPLMTGAFANRLTVGGWIRIVILWMILIYFPVAHWVWGGGFLAKLGFLDYAGGTVIHITSGFGCLGGLYYIGPRAVKNEEGPFHLGLVVIGASILLFGWFGFNSGGALAGGETAALAFTNTGIAAGFASIVWVIISYIKEKHFSIVEFITGAVAGLATITPCSGYVTPQGSVFIGIIAAVACFIFVHLAKSLKLDDALDVWGVHGMGGFIGTLLIGLFAVSAVNGISASFNQFIVQLYGVIIVAAYSFILTFVILKICDMTGTIRVSPEVQKEGLDKNLLHEKFSVEE